MVDASGLARTFGVELTPLESAVRGMLAGHRGWAPGLWPGPSMESEALCPRSHLFTVRVWLEPLEDGQSEWRGKVQHVPGGEARYFREWSSLMIFLERALPEAGSVEEPLSGNL